MFQRRTFFALATMAIASLSCLAPAEAGKRSGGGLLKGVKVSVSILSYDGESATVQITASGKGDYQTILDAAKAELAKLLQQYPGVTVTILSENAVQGSGTWTCVLVVQVTGLSTL